MVGQRGPKGNGVGPFEVKPELVYTKAPPAPFELHPIARAEWKRIAALLVAHQLLTPLDLAALEGYCSAFSTLRRCEKKLKKTLTFTSKTSFSRPKPEVAMAAKARDQVLAFATLFGLAPGPRGRLVVQPPVREEKDPFEKWNEGVGNGGNRSQKSGVRSQKKKVKKKIPKKKVAKKRKVVKRKVGKKRVKKRSQESGARSQKKAKRKR